MTNARHSQRSSFGSGNKGNTREGQIAEKHIVLDLLQKRYSAFDLGGDSLPYDVVILCDDGTYRKIQCKSGSLSGDGRTVYANCQKLEHGVTRAYLPNEVDYFAVYCGPLEKIFWCSHEQSAGRKTLSIRLDGKRHGKCLLADECVFPVSQLVSFPSAVAA